MLRVASQVQRLPPADIFIGEEQHLLGAYRRHAKCAGLLLEPHGMIDEADFHAHLAAECLVKHLFCLVRYSLGVKANLDKDFGTLKTARDFKHDIKNLSEILIQHDTELSSYPPLLELRTLLPAGQDWNEDRYRERKTSPTRTANVRRILEVAEMIVRDLTGGADAT